MSRTYPDEPAEQFPEPPATITDREGRAIEIRTADVEEMEPLVAMYEGFDPSDRAQGIPPVGEDRIRQWLESILAPECLNVVAWRGSTIVGHATLVPDADAYELAIFVASDHQDAGIGTALLRHLLGFAQREGIERVWLSVERWNNPAIALYRKVGFVVCDAEHFEMEMAIRLA